MSNTTKGAAASARGRKRVKADDILHAAGEVFMQYGFGAATTDMIQARAGVSKSTLYAYYPTKERLFEAVCRVRSAAFETMLKAAVTDETEPERFLNRFGVEFLSYLFSEEGKAFHRLMVAEIVRFPRLGKFFYNAGIKAGSEIIECYLAEAHQQGRLNVTWPALSSEHFMGMLKGDLHLRVVLNIGRPPNSRQLKRYVQATVERFLMAHRIEQN